MILEGHSEGKILQENLKFVSGPVMFQSLHNQPFSIYVLNLWCAAHGLSLGLDLLIALGSHWQMFHALGSSNILRSLLQLRLPFSIFSSQRLPKGTLTLLLIFWLSQSFEISTEASMISRHLHSTHLASLHHMNNSKVCGQLVVVQANPLASAGQCWIADRAWLAFSK